MPAVLPELFHLLDTPRQLSAAWGFLTQKPLIKLVWYGLYVVLAGGALATANQLRQALQAEKPAARQA